MVIEANPAGHDLVYFHGARVSDLVPLLDRSVQYVWILDHGPTEVMQWLDLRVPISPLRSIDARVRRLTYDLQMSTEEFVEVAGLFEGKGIDLIQSSRAMPDTLRPSALSREVLDNVLIENGALLRMWLPHAVETAEIVCYRKGYLATVLGAE